ncbi:SCO family protein [Nocardioides nanhaiensis]|uniref:SCO family protein n=1 Tax=Nocardioides nanhaiensis TaxID=1476871 RepID=A0ABP8WY83_9ACTN
MVSRPRRSAVALLAASLMTLTACSGGASADDFSGTALDTPYEVSPLPLTDTDGQPFSLADDTDAELTLVFFGYVNCPDICQTVMGSLAQAMTRLDDADREAIDVVYVTTDPERDTAPVIREYLDRLDPSFIGLTGTLDDVIEVGNSIAVGVDRVDPGGHTTKIMGIDPEDRSPVYWDDDTTGAQFAADIHTLLGG